MKVSTKILNLNFKKFFLHYTYIHILYKIIQIMSTSPYLQIQKSYRDILFLMNHSVRMSLK